MGFWRAKRVMTTMAAMRGSLPLAAILLLWCATVQADIYRYVDRSGVEHYTNVQPKGGGWQRVAKGRSVAVGKRTPARRSAPRLRAPDPERTGRYDPHIREAARVYQLPEAFIRAVMRVESNFYADAVSSKGAMGLMQLMPQTAASMGVVDPFDPRQNILGGARFLRVLANRFEGDLVLTVAAYNAGGGAVERYRGVPPYRETRRYVRRVLEHYYAFRAAARRPTAPRLARR
jgi:soluble lytic murein transglycosylase-like protein